MAFVSTSCLKGTESKFEPEVSKVLAKYEKLGLQQIELGTSHKIPMSEKDLLIYKKRNDSEFILHCMFPPIKRYDDELCFTK